MNCELYDGFLGQDSRRIPDWDTIEFRPTASETRVTLFIVRDG
jgi:hypothetical protein